MAASEVRVAQEVTTPTGPHTLMVVVTPPGLAHIELDSRPVARISGSKAEMVALFRHFMHQRAHAADVNLADENLAWFVREFKVSERLAEQLHADVDPELIAQFFLIEAATYAAKLVERLDATSAAAVVRAARGARTYSYALALDVAAQIEAGAVRPASAEAD